MCGVCGGVCGVWEVVGSVYLYYRGCGGVCGGGGVPRRGMRGKGHAADVNLAMLFALFSRGGQVVTVKFCACLLLFLSFAKVYY